MKVTIRSMILLVLVSMKIGIFAQGYQNPVIPGFYPDPSVCRVGNDYYLVNSSFEYFPGVPVWHSKDLVHWQQIGNVLDRASQLPLKNAKPANGIYAPTIRYNNGTYYMVVTNVTGDRQYGNFYVTATNPAGPWSEPIFVDQNGIDPSLFFDDNGKIYFISNRAHHPTDPRAIYQSEIDIKTGKRLSEVKEIWKGSGGSYVESPHMYKKDGFYYLQTAEGGTSYGHSVAISRSENIWGPYASCPHNPILTNRMAYSIIQGTGHADMVQAIDGSWWMVHLAFRPAIDGIHFIGRETCLTPVEWKTGEWPVVNENGQTQEFIKQSPPNLESEPAVYNKPYKNEFDQSLGFDWVYLRNPDSSNYSLTEKESFLRLKGNEFNLNDLESPAFVAKRQQHFNFKASTNLDFSPTRDNDEAGITLLMTNIFHYDFFLKQKGNQKVVCLRYALDSLNQTIKEIPVDKGAVELIVKGDKKLYTFYYKLKNGTEKQVGVLNTRFLGTEVTGGYNGVMIGLYATGNGKKSKATADFDYFEYVPN